jgi:hypothetical protein
MQAKKADFLPRFNKDEKNCFPVKIFLTPEAEKIIPQDSCVYVAVLSKNVVRTLKKVIFSIILYKNISGVICFSSVNQKKVFRPDNRKCYQRIIFPVLHLKVYL